MMGMGTKITMTAHAEVVTAAEQVTIVALRRIMALENELGDARKLLGHLRELGFDVTRIK